MGLLSWLSGKPTEAQFAEQMLAALRAVGDSRELIYDSSQNSLVVKNGAECRINLSNIFHEHLKLPVTERKANVERLARTFADIPHQKVPDDYEEIKSRLLPKIWSRFAFSEFDLQQRLNGGKSLDIPLYPLGQHLYSSLVLDEEGAMRSVSNEDLKTWGITYYEAMEDAKRNLDEATKQYAQLGDTCYCFVTGDNYDSSRILGSLIHTLNVSGDLVAVVPNRDSAFVAGTEDDEALRVMFDIVEKVAAEEGRPLSPLPLVYRDGDWEDWAPPASHTLRPAFETRKSNFLGSLYADQKEMLDRMIEDLFIATCSALTTQEGKQYLYCVWPEAVEGLLPETDLIALVTTDQEHILVRWRDVQRIAGSLLEEQDFYPVRYKVTSFPSPAQLEQLREAAKVAL